MPRRMFVIESEEEIIAHDKGLNQGQDMGYKKGFQSATVIWLFVLIMTLFLTLDTSYNLTFLHDFRANISSQLKAQIPQHKLVIDKILPDGKVVPPALMDR